MTIWTDEQLNDALKAGTRTIRFRYEVLQRNTGDGTFSRRGYLAGILPGGTVDYGYFNDIKTTCAFQILESVTETLADDEISWSDVDPFSDQLRAHFQLLMPDGTWNDWPLGTFLMDAHERATSATGEPTRTIRGYDRTIILDRDIDTAVYTVAAGAIITDQVVTILTGVGLADILVTPSAETMTAARSWDQGTKTAQVVSDLLQQIGYGSLFMDPNGVAVARPYVEPQNRAADHVYHTDDESILTPDATETAPIWDVPNRWVFVVSQPDQSVLTSTVDNRAPTSPTSQVSLGYTVTDFRTDVQAASQTALDALTRKSAAEASQVYFERQVNSAIMPDHGEADVIDFQHGPLDSGATDGVMFQETAFSIACAFDGLMAHTIRRVVNIDET
jgi:hypothetical protein